MTQRVFACLLGGALLLSACPRSSGPAPGDDSYFPLVPGARWLYTISSAEGSLEVEITGRGELPLAGRDEPVFVTDERNLGPSLGFEEVSPVGYVVEDGYFARINGMGYDGAGRLRPLGQSQATRILPVDPEPGLGWHQEHLLFESPEGGGAVMVWDADLRLVATLSVPAGSFENVLEVETSYRDDPDPLAPPKVVYRDYYARGVGLLRSVTEDPSGAAGNRIEQVLVRYDFPDPE
jgi:hypothetical protein